MIKTAYIKCWKNKDKYTCRVYSEKGKNLGTYTGKERKTTREKAKKRLKQVEFFKRQERIRGIRTIKLSSFFDLPKLNLPETKRYTEKIKRPKKYTKLIKERPESVVQMEHKIRPEIMAEALHNIIEFILEKVPDLKRMKRKQGLKQKIMELNTNALSTKQLPEASSIGQSLTIFKNMMFGKSPEYIEKVRSNLLKRML